MFGSKGIKLPKDVEEDVIKLCVKTGVDPASYVASLVRSAVKKELDKADIEEKLKGLGYIE